MKNLNELKKVIESKGFSATIDGGKITIAGKAGITVRILETSGRGIKYRLFSGYAQEHKECYWVETVYTLIDNWTYRASL